MLNSCDFQGRFAADPELRTTQTGKQVASFRMAVDRDMVDANGHRPTDWLTFTAWGKTAEFVSKYFRKGSAAVVHLQYIDSGSYTLNAQKVYTNGHTLQVGAQFRDGFDGQIYTVKQELTHGPVHSMKRYMVEKKGESNPK